MTRSILLAAAAGCALVSSVRADINLDLTTGPTATGSVNSALFEVLSTGNSGTGTFPAFVQLQHTGSEEGYNTSGAHLFDEGSSATFNHDLLLSDVTLTANGLYYEFTLDLNETQAQPMINMTALRIYTDTRAALSIADFSFQNLRYDLDAGQNATVLMDTSVSNAGSGKPDLRVLVPSSLFAGDALSTHVYLYSAFDLTSDGPEEWGFRTPGPAPNPVGVPGPGSGAVLLAGLGWMGRRRR
jgi:uncharacterized protein (TIGR03382 family)